MSFEGIDFDDMRSLVAGFPSLLRAMKPAEEFLAKAQDVGISGLKGICLIGMGGSSIAGEISKEFIHHSSLIPIISVRNYDIPACIGTGWASIVVSYSGNTEETLTAYSRAKNQGSSVFTITSGGKLLEQSKEDMIQELPTGIQPRAALPLIMSVELPLLETLTGLRISDLYSVSLDLERIAKNWSLSEHSPIGTAERMKEKIPIFIGSSHLKQVAYRAKCQINENAKSLAFNLEIPELNHNEVESMDQYRRWKIIPIFLRSQWETKRVSERIQATSDILMEKGVESIHLKPDSESVLIETLAHIHFLDMVSVELAEIVGANPLTVPTISDLKSRLQVRKE